MQYYDLNSCLDLANVDLQSHTGSIVTVLTEWYWGRCYCPCDSIWLVMCGSLLCARDCKYNCPCFLHISQNSFSSEHLKMLLHFLSLHLSWPHVVFHFTVTYCRHLCSSWLRRGVSIKYSVGRYICMYTHTIYAIFCSYLKKHETQICCVYIPYIYESI